jgi:hypothetical protein
MTNKRKIGMHRLNPIHKVDDKVFMGFFPPTLDYYNDLLQDEGFKLFLMSDGTTKEGQDRIAAYYKVETLWEQMHKSNCNYQRYFQLLRLVKTNSPVDYLWVSFIEGLHRHAATILALLCTKFDYKKKIQSGSLSIQDFKSAKIPHFVDPKISPGEQIKQIMNGQESSKMLTNTFSVEVYIPNIIHGDILQLMDSMRKQSEWIPESKTRAANKTISTLCSIWLEDTLCHSKAKKRNDCCLRPKLKHYFKYQNPTSTQSDADATKSDIANDIVYDYCQLLTCKEWNLFIKDPFDTSIRETFIELVSSDESTEGRKKN